MNRKICSEHKLWFLSSCVALLLMLTACGKPSEISDEEYKKYNEYAAPKILYSCTEESGVEFNAIQKCRAITDIDKKMKCTDDAANAGKKKITSVDYAVGVGAAVTYNDLLNDAKRACQGEFKILDSKS